MLRALFDKIDVDGSGTLDRGEVSFQTHSITIQYACRHCVFAQVAALVEAMGITLTEAELTTAMTEMCAAALGLLAADGKVPYYAASHTTPHTTLHLNKKREDLRQRKCCCSKQNRGGLIDVVLRLFAVVLPLPPSSSPLAASLLFGAGTTTEMARSVGVISSVPKSIWIPKFGQ
jgi:hypothetical protein